MKLSQLTRITEEDFAEDEQELVQKLARALNPFLEQISTAMTKNIDFDNLNQEVISYTVEVSSGIPTSGKQLTHSLKTKPKGIVCASARNLTDTAALTGAPFISYSFSGSNFNTLNIDYITGIPNGKKFELTLIIIG